MIIAVQGTHEGNNGSARLLAGLSFYGIMKQKKRTLILQFVDRSQDSVENYLIGHALRNESLIQDAAMPDISIGMDALCVHIQGTFSGEIFDECTRHLVSSNAKNLYDITTASRKEFFTRELMVKEAKAKTEHDGEGYIASLLKEANSVYDLVYCLIPSKNASLATEVLASSDINLVCIRQKRREEYTHGGKNTIFAVFDYCSGSVYHGKALAKMYDTKTVYGLLHNISYQDACEAGTLLSFMQRNIGCGKNDSNYPLIHNLDLLYQSYTGNGKKKEEEPEWKKLAYVPETDEDAWLSPISEEIVEETTESGMFKKKKAKRLRFVKNVSKAPECQENQERAEETARTDTDEPLPVGQAEPKEISDFSTAGQDKQKKRFRLFRRKKETKH